MDHYKPHPRAIRSQSSAIVVAIMLVSLIGCHSAGTSQNIQGVQQFQYGQPQAAIQHFETRAGVLGVSPVVLHLNLALQGGHDVRSIANRYGVPNAQRLG